MKPVLSMTVEYTAASSDSSSGITARFASPLGTIKYSAMLPSICTVNL